METAGDKGEYRDRRAGDGSDQALSGAAPSPWQQGPSLREARGQPCRYGNGGPPTRRAAGQPRCYGSGGLPLGWRAIWRRPCRVRRWVRNVGGTPGPPSRGSPGTPNSAFLSPFRCAVGAGLTPGLPGPARGGWSLESPGNRGRAGTRHGCQGPEAALRSHRRRARGPPGIRWGAPAQHSRGKFPTESGKFPEEDAEAAEELDELGELDELDAELLGMARAGSRPGKGAGKVLDPKKGPGDPLEKPFPEEEPAGPGSSSGNEPGRSSSSSAPAPRRPHVTFGDDVDDLVESLGLGSGADGAGNAQRAPGGQGLRKGRAGIRELLGGGSAGKILEQPGRAEFQADPKDREQPGPDGDRDEPDFPFGSYEPSVASGAGRRRGPSFPAGSSSRRSSGAAWLGLKDEDFLGLGSKDEDISGLGRKDKDFPGLGQKNEDFPGLGQKDKDFPGLGQKNKDFPGLGLKDKDFPGLGQKNEDFPRLGLKDKDFPGLGSKNKDFPGLGQKNEDFPGLESKDEDFPGLGLKDKDFPGLGSKNKDFPGLGQKNEDFLRLGLKDKDFPGLGSKDEDFPGLGSKQEDCSGSGADPAGERDGSWLSAALARRRSQAKAPERNPLPPRIPEPPGPGRLELPVGTRPRGQGAAEREVPGPAAPAQVGPGALPAQPCQEHPGALPSRPRQEHPETPPAQPRQENPRALPSWLCPEDPGPLRSQPRQEDPGALPSHPRQEDPGALPSQPLQKDPGALRSQPRQEDPGALRSHPHQEDPGALRSRPRQEDPGALPSHPRQDSQGLQSHPCQEHPDCGIALRSLQARVEELENQVRALELERAQQGLLLEGLQRQQQHLDLLESSHRSQGKVEEQQERPRQEKEQLMAQIPSRSQDTVQDRPTSQAHPTSQDHPRCQDHPRSQEQDEQLAALRDRLCQQQRDAEREQSRLQEAVADLETRLGEREQLLEQERRRAAAERSKADSLRDALEEQRRLTAQLLSMERAALDEAKGAWLEEQRAELRDRSEERRRLAAAWAEFHARERLSQERAERDEERALSMDSALRSLAKEQAELKFRSRELRCKEEQLARDREELEEAWRELRLEKEKALRAEQRLREREEQIHALAERSAREHQDGERALWEARSVRAEHRDRLQALQEQLEELRQQEQRLHQDQLSLARQREQLQQLRDELAPGGAGTLPATAPANGLGSALAAPVAPGAQGLLARFLPPVGMFLGDSGDPLASAALYGHLLLLKHRAQMDHDFLENERIFLESLKKRL